MKIILLGLIDITLKIYLKLSNYEKLNVNNFVVTKQFKKDQIKEKMKDSLIRKYIVNSLMRKKNLTGTNLGNG